uniref:Exosome complex component 10 n=1 Tax=Ciona savignyi TaxID=51511 RepID=H2ZCV9_CIOSA
NVDEFSQQSLRSLMQFIRSSHGLPSAGDDYEFYSSFSGFRDFTLHQRSRLIKNMKALLKNQGLKENFGASTSGINDDDDLTDQLVECNDGIIERVTALLDQKSLTNTHSYYNFRISIAAPSQQTVVSSWNKVGKTGKSKTFRLFHAYNIMRPQLKFKDTIDNTNAPFLPKISVKPNALRPLPRELVDIQASDKNSESEGHSLAISNLIQQIRQSKEENLAIYDHPYRFEIEQFKPMESQLKSSTPIKYKDIDPETCRLVDKPSDLLDVLSELKSKSVIAVDLEAHSYRSFQGITCLMQLSTREKDYIIDTLALRSELNILNEVFTDPRIVKVFHGADSDIVWLQRDFGIYVVNLFDTGQASRALGLARFSLDFLLTHYCNIQADKKYQLADWRVRPLPKEMLLYAQGDTHYLLYVYDMMKIDLLKAGTGMLEKVLEKSREICLLKYEKAVTTASSHLALMEKQKRRGGKKDFNSQQLEALRLIYAWRDGLARQEDESCGYVLPNHMLLQIAEILPREAQGVLACCNPVPPLLRQHVLAVHQLVLEARNKSLRSDKGGTATVESRVPVPAKTEDDYANLLQCPHDLS